MNKPITKRFFLSILVQFQFVSCIWLSTDIKYYDQTVESNTLEFSNVKTILIRMSEGDPQMIGDILGFMKYDDGTKTYRIRDRYPRMDMKNSKIPDKLRAVIKTIVSNVLFKSDYCDTIETQETLFLNETQLKTLFENSSYDTMGYPNTKTYYKNKTSVLRSSFSEKCNKIPEYSHTVDFTSDEIEILAGNKIEITSKYDRGNIVDLLNYILNYVTLGVMPLHAKFDTNVRFEHDDRYERARLLYSGTMSRSIWNYLIWPVWIFIPGSKIRFGGPIDYTPTLESPGESLFFKVEPFRKAVLTRILKERLKK
ncbi:hypothetical protein [Leptospira santarosai]|nr:hypothetical protein [Leptospira santarosai]EPG83283.1 hypothetical protein LEP1GSC048_2770 [Leptospira santarosai serovar Shermani str. 1342KT]